jgi:SAM-dependent methyltransferase
MMAVGLSQDELIPYIRGVMQEQSGTLTIACFNSPKNCTVSGDEEKVDALRKTLEKEQIFARKLQVQNAYHSAHMKEVADEYLALLGTLEKPEHPTRGAVEFFSSLFGQKVDDEVLLATYWVSNLVSPVKFKDAVLSMLLSQTGKEQASMRINSAGRALAVDLVLEVGPHSTMQSAIRECCATRSDAASVSILGLLDRRNPTVSSVLGVMGQLCARGFPIDLSALNQIASGEEPLRLLGLPGYAFNHSERNMHESRLVRNYRTRKQPRHDLLGAPVPDWNQETPRWRHYFSADEQPWIRDHQVTNSIVLPAVAYLSMALEALRQIIGPDDKAVSYKLRDVNIKQAMVIADDGDGVEASITLSRMDESSLWSSPVWRRFVITSYNPVADNWIEHCTGYIAVELETTDGPIDQGRERAETSAAEERALKLAESRCVTTVDVEAMYDNLVTSGIKFGPTFRNLSQIRRTPSNTGEATALVTIPDIATLMPFKFTYPHLIHPSTFDSMLQLFLQALLDLEGRNTLSRPLVPTFMKEVWVTADIVSAPDHHFVGRAKSKLIAYDKYESDVTWYDGASRKACVHMSGIRSTFLDSAESRSLTTRSLCHELRWVPHLESLTHASFPKSGLRSKEDDESYRLQIQRFQTASVLLVLEALDIIGDLSPGTLDGHFQKYYSWMLQIRKWFVDDEITAIKRSEVLEIAKDPIAKQKLLDEVSATNANGQIAVRMGSHIVDVLNRKEEALHLMFGQDDALERLYGELVNLGNLPTLWATYLKTIGDNKTNLRILEIGAGTGASTVPILEQLTCVSPEGLLTSSRIKTYTFTDVSAGFFEKAKERFSTYRDIMEFKALDAEKDLSEQSFDLGTYDFIIAQNVIHATADLKATFGNVRRLLKPEGFLLLQEGVRQDYFWSPIAFGQLPGWWAAVEPFRQWNPWIPSSQWGEVLRASGFEVELELADSEVSALHTQSIFVCKSVNNTKKDRAKVAIVTTQAPDAGYTALVQELKTRVEEMTFPGACHVLYYLDVANTDIEDTVCIAVMELERPFLATATEQEFDNFKMMLSACKGMLWVSGDPLQNPALGMITGITRVNRWERDIEDANLVTLHVSEDDKSSANLVDSVVRLFQQQFLEDLPISDINGEYMLKDGSMLTGRLVDAIGADDYLLSKFSRPKPVVKPMKDAGRPLKLSVAAPGLLDRLEWVTDEAYEQPLGETEVEVQTLAAGVNFRDLMIAMGEHMASCMGVEASGRPVLSPNVSNRLC